MGFFENIALAVASLKSNKMRSLLTMLGIIIGIAAVIAIETVGGSMSGSVTDSMSGLGANNITVSLKTKSSKDSEATTANGVQLRRFMPSTPDDKDLITDDMIAQFRAAFPNEVAAVELTQEVGSGTTKKYGDASVTINTTVTGVNDDYLATETTETPLLNGRWIKNETDGTRYVCAVSEKFVTQTMNCSNSQAVGQKITLTINSKPEDFYIVGVYKYDSSNSGIFGTTDDDSITTTVYLPLALGKKLANAADGYKSITVVGSAAADSNVFLNTTGSYFATFYTRNDAWTVSASSLASLLSSLTTMLGTISLAVSAIAAISLVVGGIGVMNIMTVSVTERTREIGTRKALGAPSSAIRLQFITESMVLCLIGGVIGIALGQVMGSVATKLIGYEAHANLEAIVIAVGFSVAIGVFFGYYPANKAAKMDPIDALRYE